MSGFMAVKRKLVYSGSEKHADKRQWLLDIHMARIKNLLEASALSDGGWKIDTAKLGGKLAYIDPDTKTETAGAVYAHHDYSESLATGCVFGTFFKYQSAEKTRYYYLMTCGGMKTSNSTTPTNGSSDVYPVYYRNLGTSYYNPSDGNYAGGGNFPGTMGYSYGYNEFKTTEPKDAAFGESGNSPLLNYANEMKIKWAVNTSVPKYFGFWLYTLSCPSIDSEYAIELMTAVNGCNILRFYRNANWEENKFTCTISGDFIDAQIADPTSRFRAVCCTIYACGIWGASSSYSSELYEPYGYESSNRPIGTRCFVQDSAGKWVCAKKYTVDSGFVETIGDSSVTPYSLPFFVTVQNDLKEDFPAAPNGWRAKGFAGKEFLRSVFAKSSTPYVLTAALDGDFVRLYDLLIGWDKSNAARVGI